MNVTISHLESGDCYNGFIETLSALRDPEITPQEAIRLNMDRRDLGICTYVAKIEDEVVGTFSVFVELKFIHKGGKVAHVEDVAVREDYQRKGIGRQMEVAIEAYAKSKGCYKIILDCGDHNIGFYEKCGYYLHEKMMRKDI